MTQKKIGFLHPGAMGSYLAASVVDSGHQAYWVSEGRSEDSRKRASQIGMIEVKTIAELCEICSIVISVCPPASAADVASDVLVAGFTGIYVDANAISPNRVKAIAEKMLEAGVSFVDGGVIGLPLPDSTTTYLYLSGEKAEEVAECFTAGPLLLEVIGEEVGKASALKMCYAAKTKGTTALLCALEATAQKLGVRAELENQWRRENPDSPAQIVNSVRQVTAKAWRFSGEMKEIAETFEEAGLPPEFYLAAAEVYQRMAGFKNAENTPEIEEVLAFLSDEK